MDIVAKIKARVKVNETTGCWEWQGSLYPKGYGQFWTGKKCTGVHRAMFEAMFGELPTTTCVCHRCDNPRCCNPDHLFAGSSRDNKRDSMKKRRAAHRDRHPLAKLTKIDVIAIRARRLAGEGLKSLADEFGVGVSQISRVSLGKCWNYPPDQ